MAAGIGMPELLSSEETPLLEASLAILKNDWDITYQDSTLYPQSPPNETDRIILKLPLDVQATVLFVKFLICWKYMKLIVPFDTVIRI